MGALLRGIKREQARRGMLLIAPGTLKAVNKFQAQVYVSFLILFSFKATQSISICLGAYKRRRSVCNARVLLSSLNETICLGGRVTPFMARYRPQLFLRTADVTVDLSFPEGTPDADEKMVRVQLCQSF